MSDNDTNPEQAGPAKTSKTVVFALLAGVLGLGAGAGLYAFSGQKGNVDSARGGCRFDQSVQQALNKAATGDVAAFVALDKPYSADQLAFVDGERAPVSMTSFKGKTVLLNLWATWCAPCRAEMPALDALQNDLGGDDFEVVPVSVDLGDDAKPKAFFAEIGLQHMRFFHDGKMATLTSLKKDGLAYGLPATLLIDQNGCVLGNLNGPAEWAGEDAKRLVKAGMAAR